MNAPARMKAADISDERFLAAIRTCEDLRPTGMNSRWEVGAVLDGDLDLLREYAVADQTHDYSTVHHHEPIIPEKVVLAKARSLIRRGLIDGCACGCRGDFEIVERPAGSTEEETPAGQKGET